MISELLAIYNEAIPASERKSEAAFRAMVSNPNYQLQVAHREGRVAGFSLLRQFIAADAALLEYLAVTARYRGQGIGQALFPSRSGFTLIEVDTENLGLQRFYRNRGAREIQGLLYLMPPVCEEMPPPMNLWLTTDSLPPTVPRTQIQSWLEGIYKHVYGLPADDPRISTMLEPLPQQVNLK